MCHELLNNPKVFPCLHSYCYECIVKLSHHECGLVCPECHVPVEVRSFFDHCSVSVRAFFKNSSVGEGGVNKKGPYYTECGEMIDGC